MAYQYIIYEKKNKVAYVTINRPERLNALHKPADWELHEIWTDFRDDPDLCVAIITGAGDRAFCAGMDAKFTAEHLGEPRLPSPPGSLGGISKFFECWNPIIAAVNGLALGGGFETAMSCDIIIAASDVRLGLPEAKRGIVPGIGIYKFHRQVPLKVAMEETRIAVAARASAFICLTT